MQASASTAENRKNETNPLSGIGAIRILLCSPTRVESRQSRMENLSNNIQRPVVESGASDLLHLAWMVSRFALVSAHVAISRAERRSASINLEGM